MPPKAKATQPAGAASSSDASGTASGGGARVHKAPESTRGTTLDTQDALARGRSLGLNGPSMRELSLGSLDSDLDILQDFHERLEDDLANIIAAMKVPTSFPQIDAAFGTTTATPDFESVHWAKLPPETQVKILAHLPASKLLAHLEAGSLFEDVIHDNQLQLARITTERRKAELKAAIDGFDYSSCSLFDAVKHWFNRKGSWRYKRASEDDKFPLEDFVHHDIAKCDGVEEEDVPALHNYLEVLTAVHADQHLHRMSTRGEISYERSVETAAGVNLPSRLKANRDGEFNDMLRANAGELETVHETALWRQRSLLHRPLTDLCCVPESRVGALDEDAFLSMFNLPRVPQSGPVVPP